MEILSTDSERVLSCGQKRLKKNLQIYDFAVKCSVISTEYYEDKCCFQCHLQKRMFKLRILL